MGYTSIVQYGEVTEIYEYEKPLRKKKKPKKRRKVPKTKYFRSRRSVARAKKNFFRLVHHNVVSASTVAFVTLTLTHDATRRQFTQYLSDFTKRINKYYESKGYPPVSYIGVPELTKKARLHLHLLMFDLQAAHITGERVTRNLQRQYRRGYLDIRSATDRSPKIAGYMAKYMAKGYKSIAVNGGRAYTTSRTIKKIGVYGSNTFDEYLDLLVPDVPIAKIDEYEVKYWGKCTKTTYITKNAHINHTS